MDLAIIESLKKSLETGEKCVLCTIIDEEGSTPRSVGSKMLVWEDGSIVGTIGGGVLEYHVIQEALRLFREDKTTALYSEEFTATEADDPKAACGGKTTVFLELIGRKKELIIFGAGHVGKAIARVASFLNYSVTLWDEREEFANPDTVPWAQTIACPLDEAFERYLSFHKLTHVVVVTRGHSLDTEVVRKLDGKTACYIGVIGSKRKIAVMKENLLKMGVSKELVDRLYAPIGLPIKAETPEEIAISVMAEIIAVDNGANVKGLRQPLDV